MKLYEDCLSCAVNQVIHVLRMTGVREREEIYHAAFDILSRVDFGKTSPEMSGDLYRMIREKTGTEDPYADIRRKCNALMLDLLPRLREGIRQSEDPFRRAVISAILGNIIDFSAPGKLTDEVILRTFENAGQRDVTVDDIPQLREACAKAKTLLYVGDNCGEIAADTLLLSEIRRMNPDVEMIYAVRGAPVVNDVLYCDAVQCGIPGLAQVIDTGDDAQGAVLSRCGKTFREAYRRADVIIAKGQGNMEGLTESPDPRVYCLLMAKCVHIAATIGVQPGELAVIRLGKE